MKKSFMHFAGRWRHCSWNCKEWLIESDDMGLNSARDYKSHINSIIKLTDSEKKRSKIMDKYSLIENGILKAYNGDMKNVAIPEGVRVIAGDVENRAMGF